MAVAAVNEYSILIKELNEAIKIDRAARVALSSVLALQKRRIFQDGQEVNGGKIGTYSTNPISISKKAQARNTGKTYFKGGYSEYKSLIGKNPGFKILRNTDQMMMGYTTFVLGDNEYGLGFNNEFDYNKTQWQEEQTKKDIFASSESETDIFEQVLFDDLNRKVK